MFLESRYKAIISMSFASLFLSLVPVFIKTLHNAVPVDEKIFSRALIAAIVTSFLMIRKRESFRPGNIRLLLTRSTLGSAGMFLYFRAIENLQLSEAVTLNRLSPFFVLIFAAAFLREKLVRFQILAIFLAFMGVVVIVQPGRIPLTQGSIFAVFSAIFAGGAYTSLRALRKYDPPLRIVFWFSVFLAVLSLPSVLTSGVIPGTTDLLLLLAIGISGVLGQILMTFAYRYAPGGEVAIYGYLSVVFSIIWQMLIWNSIPSAFVTGGAVLVLAGGLLNYCAGRSQKCKFQFPNGFPGSGGNLRK